MISIFGRICVRAILFTYEDNNMKSKSQLTD